MIETKLTATDRSARLRRQTTHKKTIEQVSQHSQEENRIDSLETPGMQHGKPSLSEFRGRRILPRSTTTKTSAVFTQRCGLIAGR